MGYRRLAGGKAGTWIARHYEPAEGRKYQSLGAADDMLTADGVGTLTWAQAQARAQKWWQSIERDTGRVVEPVTVREAMDAYLADYRARGGKAEAAMLTTIKAHILPALGDVEVARLTFARIREWHRAVAAAPARLRTKTTAKKNNVRKAEGPEAHRARRSTANRVLTVLKAALTHAYQEGHVPSDDAWRRVKPFARVDAPKVRYLTDDEAVRLVNACGVDLRKLVTAALLTGCRYAELASLRAEDFDPDAGMLHVRAAKAGARAVVLTEDGQRFFRQETAGRARDALVLARGSGGAWGKSHQFRPLREACISANIAPAVSFHVLRHTFASRLAMKRVPMAVIAAALGNQEAICRQDPASHRRGLDRNGVRSGRRRHRPRAVATSG